MICRDIDECLDKTHACDSLSICRNTIGTYKCDCINGFESIGSEIGVTGGINAVDDGSIGTVGVQCVDTNECTSPNPPCVGPQWFCTNTVGSYECTCHLGYTKRGENCEDIDECSKGTHKCNENSDCINSVGAYKCSCHTGWITIDSGASEGGCVDIDECKVGTHLCSKFAHCVNTLGPGSITGKHSALIIPSGDPEKVPTSVAVNQVSLVVVEIVLTSTNVFDQILTVTLMQSVSIKMVFTNANVILDTGAVDSNVWTRTNVLLERTTVITIQTALIFQAVSGVNVRLVSLVLIVMILMNVAKIHTGVIIMLNVLIP